MKPLETPMPKEAWIAQTKATLRQARNAIIDALNDLDDIDDLSLVTSNRRALFINTVGAELELKLIVLKSLALRRVEGDD